MSKLAELPSPALPAMSDTANTLSSRLKTAAVVARWASVILLVAMFIGTHIPAHMSPGVSFSDKAIHYVAYMALSISLLFAWDLSTGVLLPQHYFAVWLFCTLYGVFDELTQIPVGRTCDGLDWLADLGGIVTGLIIYRLLRPVWCRWS